MHLPYFLVALASLLLSTLVQAGTITLQPATTSLSVVSQAELYADDSGTLTVEEVQRKGAFYPSDQDNLGFGFTQARVWLRFSLSNQLQVPQQRILYLQYFLLDEVILYTETDAGFNARYSGRKYLREHNQSPLPTRFFHFEIDLPANTTQTFYLALKSEDAIATSVDLLTLEKFQRLMITDTVSITLFSGLVLANLCFALFMLLKLKELEVLYYLGFLISHHLFTIMLLEGVPASFLMVNK